jgi:phage head maturation protease
MQLTDRLRLLEIRIGDQIMDYTNVKVPVKLNLGLDQSYETGGDTYIQFLASNNTTSLSGHRMELSALDKMKQSAISLPVFLNHDPNRLVGSISSVTQTTPDEFRPVAKLLNEINDMRVDQDVKTLKNWLNNDVKVGASIGASILAYSLSEEDNKTIVNIKDLNLLEVSLTPIPALESSKGTVRNCPNGLCQQLGKQILNQTYLNDNNVIGEDNMSVKELAEQIKYTKYNALEKRAVVKNLVRELQKIEDQMNGKLNTWKMDEYGSLEEDKKVLVSVLQGLDPTYSVRKSLGF